MGRERRRAAAGRVGDGGAARERAEGAVAGGVSAAAGVPAGRRAGDQRGGLPGQGVIGRQVAGGQLARQRQVLGRLRRQAALAFHRAEPGEHLDPGGRRVAVHPAVPPPGAGQPGPGGGAVSRGVLGGGQVGLGGQHPWRVRALKRGELTDQVVIDGGGPAVLADPLEHRRVHGRRGDGALVAGAVQAFLGGVGESGPEPRRLRVAEGDQDPGVQGGGDGEVGGGAAGIGVGGPQDVGQDVPGAREITGRRQGLRLGGELSERRCHVSHSAHANTMGTSFRYRSGQV
ncbi:hypothetical protein [Actinoplanes philippinensis]|uniref:hypothetical protein n=1 Tax=Actinoplanes philippinensis TaxID=35752 RepID=UPI00340587FA